MSDGLIRAITQDGCYRIAVASTSETVAELIRRHAPGPVAACALARAVTSAALLGTGEKDFHRLGLQWNGRGPFSVLIADVRPGGHLRAYLGDPGAAAESIEDGVGAGVLTVTRQDPEGRLVQGSLPIASGAVDEDVEYYLRHSEQIPSRLRTFIDLGEDGFPSAVAGVLVQTLPGGAAEALLGDAGALSAAMLERSVKAAQPLEVILADVLVGIPVKVLREESLGFGCQCSLERVERGVAMLGPDELLDMIAKEEPAAVRCDFCSEEYRVDIPGLCRLYDSLLPEER